MKSKNNKYAAAIASLAMVASSQAAITTITTDGFNTGAISDNWNATTTTTAGQWSISQTTPGGGFPDPGGGRTVAGDPFGYGGQPAAPQEGTGQAQISNGYADAAHTATITDTANHFFNVGDQVAIEFFTARRADGADTGPLGLTVSLVGAGTFSYGAYMPTTNTWTQSTTSSFTILTAGNYNVQFASVPEAGDRTSYLDSVSYKVEAIPEPSAALLGGLSMLALLRRRRG